MSRGAATPERLIPSIDRLIRNCRRSALPRPRLPLITESGAPARRSGFVRNPRAPIHGFACHPRSTDSGLTDPAKAAPTALYPGYDPWHDLGGHPRRKQRGRKKANHEAYKNSFSTTVWGCRDYFTKFATDDVDRVLGPYKTFEQAGQVRN